MKHQKLDTIQIKHIDRDLDQGQGKGQDQDQDQDQNQNQELELYQNQGQNQDQELELELDQNQGQNQGQDLDQESCCSFFFCCLDFVVLAPPCGHQSEMVKVRGGTDRSIDQLLISCSSLHPQCLFFFLKV